jgi:hypothetical protein
MSKFGTPPAPDPTPYGEKPGSMAGCCLVTRVLEIKIVFSNLKVGHWLIPHNYCADVAITGKITNKKACFDAEAFLKEHNIPVGNDYVANCSFYDRTTFYTTDPVTEDSVVIRDVVARGCGSCDPQNLSECNCESETEAFPPFTSKVCSWACDKGWGKSAMQDLGYEINNKLLNLKVGGCSCNGCESCEKFEKLPQVRGKTWLDIPSLGEFTLDALRGTPFAAAGKTIAKILKDHVDLCP